MILMNERSLAYAYVITFRRRVHGTRCLHFRLDTKIKFYCSWTTTTIMIIDPDDPENDQPTESPLTAYEQWRQRKTRAEKNYPLERAEADRKTIREIRDLVDRLQHSAAAQIVQENIKQIKERIMWVLLRNRVKNQSREVESEKRLEELTKSNQKISQKIELLLSFYAPALREKTRNELDFRAELFVQKMFANRSRKRK
jgi:hypothetical protein